MQLQYLPMLNSWNIPFFLNHGPHTKTQVIQMLKLSEQWWSPWADVLRSACVRITRILLISSICFVSVSSLHIMLRLLCMTFTVQYRGPAIVLLNKLCFGLSLSIIPHVGDFFAHTLITRYKLLRQGNMYKEWFKQGERIKLNREQTRKAI